LKVPASTPVGSAPITVTGNGIASNIFPFTVSAGSAPGTPGMPTYTGMSSSTPSTLTVNWASASGVVNYYTVERATSTQVYVPIATTSALTYGDSGLSANTTYYYFITATNGGGTGPNSASSSILTLPDMPGAPTFTGIAATTLTVNWSAPGGGAAYYKIERAPNSGSSPGTFTQIATTSAASYGDSGLTASTIYWYRIRATNVTGDGAYSGNASTTTASVGNTPPNAPTSTTPANGIQDVPTLAVFQMTATDPNSDNVQYKVVVYTNGGCTDTSTIYE